MEDGCEVAPLVGLVEWVAVVGLVDSIDLGRSILWHQLVSSYF